MTVQTAWLLAVFAVLAAAAIGFFVGRRSGAGKQRIEELECEVRQQQERIDDYRQEVATHFDKTATLFVSMAGPYKELFEHLSSGYEKLSSGSARDFFKQRVDALLVGNGREAGEDGKLLPGAGLAAAGAAEAGAAGPMTTSERAAVAGEGAPQAVAERGDAEVRPGTRAATEAEAAPDTVTEIEPAPAAEAAPRQDVPHDEATAEATARDGGDQRPTAGGTETR